MTSYNVRLCNVCFVFPCMCGKQYESLTPQQLMVLQNILKGVSDKNSVSLQSCLSAEELGLLPKRFTKYLFETNKDSKVDLCWKKLKQSNLLWKSCLAMMLTKYTVPKTTEDYYNFVLSILEQFDVKHNDTLAKILTSKDVNGNINVPNKLVTTLEFTNTISDESPIIISYINNCVKLATSSNVNMTVIDLISFLYNIILAISDCNITDKYDIIDNTPIDVEDKMYYVDDMMLDIIYENFSDEFTISRLI